MIRPTAPTARLRTALALAALAVAITLAGCAGASTSSDGAPPAAMTREERAALLPQGFPPQVPVVAGNVADVGGLESAKGTGVWTYTIETTASPGAVVSWYTSGLTALNWDPVGAPAEAGTMVLGFAKGTGGQIVLRISATDSGGSRVEASVSLGMPVTPAQ